MYVKQTSEYFLLAIFYVDALIILTNNVTQLKWLKSELKKEVEMSDLKKLHYCLGLKSERNKETHTNTMKQRKYIEEVLKRFNMEECKPVGTPFDVNSKLLKCSDEEFVNVQRKMIGVPYKARVRFIMNAMMAPRADITFSVSTVSQFMLKAGPPHWMVVKRIIRYLKGILDFKLCLICKNIVMRGFCDVDWTEDANERRSIRKYIFFVGVGVISWKCKKQPTIVLLTTGAIHGWGTTFGCLTV